MSPQNRKPTNPYFDPNANHKNAPKKTKTEETTKQRKPVPQKKKSGSWAVFLLAGVVVLAGAWAVTKLLQGPPPSTSPVSAILPDTESSTSEAEPPTSEPSSIEAPQINKTEWNLILVNANNPLPDGFAVDTVGIGRGYEFDARAADALNQMLADGNKTGLQLMVCSAYRSNARQTELFAAKKAEYIAKGYSEPEAYSIAATIVAPPGTSEHATGLAADIVSVNYQVLDEGFAGTPEFAWLSEHAAEYGFVLRFPKGKEDVTGIIYEPWHYRYVGVEHAQAIKEKNICLEEYL